MFAFDPDHDREARYDELCARASVVAGAAHARQAELVDLVAAGLADQQLDGPGIHSPGHWVAWRCGVSLTVAHRIVRVAGRAAELPCCMAAFRAGLLSLDHLDLVAQHVPAAYEASVCTMAQESTVSHLARVLPGYRFGVDGGEDTSASGGTDRGRCSTDEQDEVRVLRRRNGALHLRARLTGAAAERVAAALQASRDQQVAERRAATEADPATEPVTDLDALVGMADASLELGQARHPGSSRYQVYAHLQAGPTGHLELRTQDGRLLPDGTRRHILCDCRLRGLVWDGTTPIGAGRLTRAVPPTLRRIVLHRQGGHCAVPGCTATHRLEAHHIWHWEDGGPTESHNLVGLCARHHHLHHQGQLGIAGNPEQATTHPEALRFTDHHGRVLDPGGRPMRPRPVRKTTVPPTVPEARYRASMCDRWDHRIHFERIDPATGPPAA